MFTAIGRCFARSSWRGNLALLAGALLGGLTAVAVQGYASPPLAPGCNHQACSRVCVPPYGCSGECFSYPNRDCPGGNCTQSFPCGPN